MAWGNKNTATAVPDQAQGNPDGAAATTPAAKAPKAYRYRCTEPCTFLKRYRGVGDIVELTEKRAVPHFELVE